MTAACMRTGRTGGGAAFGDPAMTLTECVPGGLVYGGFSHLDSSRFDEIEVVPADEVEE